MTDTIILITDLRRHSVHVPVILVTVALGASVVLVTVVLDVAVVHVTVVLATAVVLGCAVSGTRSS